MDITLVVDIGNTNIVCAVFDGGKIVARCRILSAPLSSIETYYSQLGKLLPEYPLTLIKYVAIGSVVPALTPIWEALFARFSSARVFTINGLSPIGLAYQIKDTSSVGADLVANAYAAWKIYQEPAIVVDLGTATTIQLILPDGLYAGLVIAPGMKTAAAQLFANAAQLEAFPLEAPHETLGNGSQAALCSGIVLGHALMIVGFVAEISRDYPQFAPYKVILTGGLAAMIAPLCHPEFIVDSDLTLQGLHLATSYLISQA
jgi:type III pantothenate kinase